ncbi:MAG: fused MFS/spermidine synthase [Fibrobacterota bacterium]|nr:MAG: fused MFS/spermidine synthase [Fibrobacterota bacterium]
MLLKRLPLQFLILFILSGIAGLVHETVWARYLGIILGHSAYGQILTLMVYMGGIGLGSALAGRFVHRIKNPLNAYVLVELGIGIGGFVFHHEFLALRSLLLDSGILVGTSETTATLASVAVGVTLTLPFALMIGMTYPLATAYFIRLQKDGGEDSIARLYFGNSLGAAFGAILNSYFLIPHLGTAGALIVAGGINTGVAGLAWLAHNRSKRDIPAATPAPEPAKAAKQESNPPSPSRVPWLLLASALVTGLSSFFYEIGWIRYLALLLGSSTHAFDLMVSAFILGLAGGAWTVHRNPSWNLTKTLIVAQICMAGAAVIGVVAYEPIFRAANELNGLFVRSAGEYPLYTATRYLFCLLVMLPASWFAGMTLPLICRLLLASGHDESTTGKVYAWNTLGAIVGAAIGGLVLMPMVGLFRLVGVGAAIDLALALLLLYKLIPQRSRVLTSLACVSFGLVLWSLVIEPKNHIVASGLFRSYAKFRAPEADSMIHGRTASIRILRHKNLVVLSTNGKSDASLYLSSRDSGLSDAMTQLMGGWIGRAYSTDKFRAAMIGMGSGQTANTVLQDSRCTSLDLIEIEPAVYELSRWFMPANRLVYEDPRIKVHFQDARIFFARQQSPYDLVISVPSNPWVSGVSSLFTDEFYSEMKNKLAKSGVFVQWFHIYGTNDKVALSVLKTVRKNFEHVMVVSLPNPVDFYIVASPSPFTSKPKLTGVIDSVYLESNFMSRGDFGGGLETIHSEAIDLATASAPINSEFQPFVDNEAERAFFLHEQSVFLSQIDAGSISIDAVSRSQIPLDIFASRGRRSLLARSIDLEPKFKELDLLLSKRDSVNREEKAEIFLKFRTEVPAWTWAIPQIKVASEAFQRSLDSTRDSSAEASLFRWWSYTNQLKHDSGALHFYRALGGLPSSLTLENIRDIYAYLIISDDFQKARIIRESLLKQNPKIEERIDFAILGRLLTKRAGAQTIISPAK